jgi:FkbM family methyltransferase
MDWRSPVIDAAVRGYGLFNRAGLLDRPFLRRAFVSSYFAYKRWVEDPFASLIRHHSTWFRGAHVIDVGANIGYTATLFGGAVDQGFRVFAFEPERRNFDCLVETVAARHLNGTVEPIHAAVGATRGSIDLWYNADHHGDHRILTPELGREKTGVEQRQRVDVISLDDFAHERGLRGQIGFVKVDVQGYELPVCQGMEGLLSAERPPIVVVEYFPEGMRELGFTPEDLPRWFRERGWQILILERDGTLSEWALSGLDRDLGRRRGIDLICCAAGVVS